MSYCYDLVCGSRLGRNLERFLFVAVKLKSFSGIAVSISTSGIISRHTALGSDGKSAIFSSMVIICDQLGIYKIKENFFPWL